MEDRLLIGRYRLTEKIGGGGMADVYRATDETLGRTVAVKVMHESLAADPAASERFRREARAAAGLRDPHIVTVYDSGHDGDTYFIVMELVDGEDLGTRIMREGPLPSREIARIGAQVAEALSAAHTAGVVHRDISPGNILLDESGSARVVDFGIARVGLTELTQTGSVLGSASYVSPEQAQGLEVGPASDLYSLGAVLYRAVTGQAPFSGESAIAVASKHVNEPLRPPRELRPDIDPQLDAAIERALRKDPSQRFADAAEMGTALRASARAESPDALADTAVMPTVARPVEPAELAAAPVAAADSTEVTHATSATGMRASRLRRLVPWLVAAVLIVALGWAAMRCSPPAQRPAETTRTSEPTTTPNDSTVVVPRVVGLTESAARAAITAAGLRAAAGDAAYAASVPAGRVVSQSPAEGTTVAKGATVRYSLSRGPAPASTPNDGAAGRSKGKGSGKGKKND